MNKMKQIKRLLILSLFFCIGIAQAETLKADLASYQKFYKTHLKQADFQFAAGAQQADFTALKKIIKVEIPHELKQLLTISNGQKTSTKFALFPDGFRLMSSQQIEEVIQVKQKGIRKHEMIGTAKALGVQFNQQGVKDEYIWNAKWIPIATDSYNNYLCLDLDPAKDGTVGQLITVYLDDIAMLRSKSISAYFSDIQQGFKNDMVYVEDGMLLYEGSYEEYDEDYYEDERGDSLWSRVYYLTVGLAVGLAFIGMGLIISFLDHHKAITDVIVLGKFEKLVKIQMYLGMAIGLILIASLLIGMYCCFWADLISLWMFIVINLGFTGLGKLVMHFELNAKNLTVTCSGSGEAYRELCLKWDKVGISRYQS